MLSKNPGNFASLDTATDLGTPRIKDRVGVAAHYPPMSSQSIELLSEYMCSRRHRLYPTVNEIYSALPEYG